MKKSKFNFLVEKNDEYALLFNFYSRGFLKLSPENYSQYESLSFDPDSPLAANLRQGFFVHDDDTDELRIYDARNRVVRYGGTHYGVTIVPTLDCIFSCEYCFESRQNVYMTSETEEQVVGFVKAFARDARSLHIGWFGGEPLMAKDTIDRISRDLMRHCDEKGIKYSADLVTNGYLLDSDAVHWLKLLRVNQIQVTFDGCREDHDQRRKLRSGRGTFDTIMDNLAYAADKFQTNVRVNIDKKNVANIEGFYSALEEHNLQNKVSLYYGTIFTPTAVCKDYESNCLDLDALSRLLLEFHGTALDKHRDYVSFPFPLAVLGGCGAAKPRYFVIDPQGYLHKCLNTVGTDDEHIGHISQPVELNSSLAWWLTWDPLQYDDCRECHALPLCSGGCPYLRRKGEHACSYYKTTDYMRDLLKMYHDKVYLRAPKPSEQPVAAEPRTLERTTVTPYERRTRRTIVLTKPGQTLLRVRRRPRIERVKHSQLEVKDES